MRRWFARLLQLATKAQTTTSCRNAEEPEELARDGCRNAEEPDALDPFDIPSGMP